MEAYVRTAVIRADRAMAVGEANVRFGAATIVLLMPHPDPSTVPKLEPPNGEPVLHTMEMKRMLSAAAS